MKPDIATRATLAAVIRNDSSAIEKMAGRLQTISQTMDPDSFTELAAAAYLLHNIYNALENSFEQISRSFENHVKDLAQWHKELLGKMFLEIPGIRPAVLPRELIGTLNDLRGFRHVFRHSYDFEIDPKKLQLTIDGFLEKQTALMNALTCFGHWLMRDE
jgi:hypothetical protein